MMFRKIQLRILTAHIYTWKEKDFGTSKAPNHVVDRDNIVLVAGCELNGYSKIIYQGQCLITWTIFIERFTKIV